MAWLTVLGPAAAQIDYRLRADAGCGQVDYRLADGDSQEAGQEAAAGAEPGRGLTWIGDGLREFGIEPGTPLTPEDHQAARRLMAGRDLGTGKRLVKPKLAVHPRAMLPGEVLLQALQQAAVERGQSVEGMLAGAKWAAKRAGRLERGVEREGEAHRIPVGDAERLAAAAGLDLDALYEPDRLAQARAHRDERVQVGNRGYDLTLELPKSVSVLYGLADPELAQGVEDTFAEAVYDTVAALEQWAGYGMRGRHGDGKRATRIAGTGVLGWILWHRAARPVGGQAPDPHLHAHVMIANMLRGIDGKWSTLGAGGRDVHRHVKAAGTLVQARLRRLLTERYGLAWERDPHTGAWEIAGIGEDLRGRFSKRGGQVADLLKEMGLEVGSASTAQAKNAAARTREDKNSAPTAPVDLRTSWAAQARAAGVEPAALTAACVGAARSLPARPSPEEIAAWIWRSEDGLTGHDKIVTRADVLAEVMDALPDGVAGLADADALTDQVLTHGPVVELPPAGAVHLTNNQRYTSSDVIAAEQTALAAARAGYGAGLAVVDDAAAELALGTFEAGAGIDLSPSQRQVLERLLGGGHGVEAVIGVAGAGKTLIMAAARSAWESRGLVVAGAATAAVAAMGLAAESGIGSDTIATWLRRIESGPGLDGVDVLVIDEAAIVDDRQLATLLSEARRTRTKVVLIGDPVQLRAIGVGGTFAAIHRQVDGLVLGENRRQRHDGERAALQLWRDGQREQALRTWAQARRVHAGRAADDTMAAMLADWQQARAAYASDVHAELAAVALLAGSNADVDRLNAAARAVRRAAGEITGPETRYRQPDGRTLALAIGDHVRVHKNDYRARRGQGANVLNGYRGRVVAIDDQRRVLVEWRAPYADGLRIEQEWIEPDYIAAGGLGYGTAMTVAATQGATVDRTLVYGHGLDPHSLYAAMSRDRESVRLYLPRELLETDADRARLGEPDSYEVELQRALAAYAATLRGDRADKLVTAEPDPIAHQHAERATEPGRAAAPASPQQIRDRLADFARDWGRDDAHDKARSRDGDADRGADRGAQRDVEPASAPSPDRDPGGRQSEPERAAQTPQAAAEHAAAGDDEGLRRARQELQDAEREAMAAVRRASALLALTQRPLGVGLLDDTQLDARVRPLAERVTAAAAAIEAADQQLARYARDGGGPTERALQQRRAQLAEQVRQVNAAEQAAHRLQQARQTVIDGREQVRRLRQREADMQRELAGLGSLRPSHRARRRELEAALPRIREDLAAVRERLAPVLEEGPALEAAAEQTAAAAPPSTAWPLVRRLHTDLERDLDSAQRGARARDVDAAAHQAAQARDGHQKARAELAAVRDERERRADLPPDQRDDERAARAEHAQRQREAADRGDGPTRPTPGRQRERERREAYRPPPAPRIDRGPGLSR
ncbi:conjugative relaxase-like TrwC/TraI family protein [Nonomuraea thailandensis]|uniref:Conjugative relaxase-like TrwC/TraI family protein n=1 Tax=Nonomuraea thailandensis TaxID=1188745 RepID=A0A9X2H377_9ACTN|nr:MobF family relaxase [Nonomuraea thailandensis]MCP2365763.1 conjugative relaxase-like TrwC/TraI family protein [Nonomuraea thailandensis]